MQCCKYVSVVQLFHTLIKYYVISIIVLLSFYSTGNTQAFNFSVRASTQTCISLRYDVTMGVMSLAPLLASGSPLYMQSVID